MKILVDSDVLVALINGQEEQSPASRDALEAAMEGDIELVVTPLIAANVMYVLKRKWRTTGQRSWLADINHAMTAMLSTMIMIPVDERDFLASFASEFRDKEDGVQYFSAMRSRQGDLILTCTVKDYSSGELPVREPGQFQDEFLR